MKAIFQTIVLGCTGGPKEGNLSSYLFSPLDREEWFCLDAGSLLSGIQLGVEKKSFQTLCFENPILSHAGEILLKKIKGYLISHAHLDHLAALVLNSQVDEPKVILGIDSTIDNIRDHIFNGRIWPNYGSEGVEPVLNKYRYIRLPLHQQVPIPGTKMQVEAYLLSHPRGYPSTAFLIESNEHYLLYFGDTSSDSMEMEKHLSRIWHRISPLLQEKKLRGIFIECSYPRTDAQLAVFGHLNTNLLIKELDSLAKISGASLQDLPVVVTHRKESLTKGPDAKEVIKEELLAFNERGIRFIFPTQGERIEL